MVGSDRLLFVGDSSPRKNRSSAIPMRIWCGFSLRVSGVSEYAVRVQSSIIVRAISFFMGLKVYSQQLILGFDFS